jgi:hypothetical protein
MQLVSTWQPTAAHMETLLQRGHGMALGTLVGFVLVDKRFELLGKQAANRRSSAGGEDTGFLKCFPV